jgi:hypothetical protein
MTAFLFEPGEEMRLEDVAVENVRVHGEGQGELIRLKPVVNQYMRNKVPGHINHVLFRKLSVTGAPGPYRVQVMGADETHAVSDISLENVEILGFRLSRDSQQLEAGSYVSGLHIGPLP